MDLPPDPYLALGLSKDATQANVKMAHRKLVLKCHPDKVADPDAKQTAADQFHKIQTAYEILIDEDRRARYDAQVRLASLKKEAMERPSVGVSRSSHYKSAHEASARPTYAPRASERMTPQYEERRPSYAAADYFEVKARSSPARKEPEYEPRASKRGEPKERPRTSTKDTKESERERRRENQRRSDRETRKDRESKYNTYVDDVSESESDEYAKRSRRARENLRVKEAQYEEAYRHRKEGASYPDDAYMRKINDAMGHIHSSRTRPRADPMDEASWARPRTEMREDTERRPSAARMSSNKDKVEYVKHRDGRPAIAVRRAPERTKTKDHEPLRPEYFRHEPERRSSAEKLAERRPPMLNTSKSSPSDIRIPGMEKQRAQSVQMEPEHASTRISPVKRAETMPYDLPRVSTTNTSPVKSSNLRQTEFSEGLATPATTPDNASPPVNKYNYSKQYADDAEYPTPDGYRTEVREPGSKGRPVAARKITRSPSPIKESREQPRERDERPRDFQTRDRDGRSARTASARYPSTTHPSMPARTTSYVYGGPGQGVEVSDRARPSLARGESSRAENLYYGEVQTTRSPGGAGMRRTTADEGIRYQKPVRPEDIRVQSGYSSKRPSAVDRPSFVRSGSGYSGVKA